MSVSLRRAAAVAGLGLAAVAPPASAATLHVPAAVERSDCATTDLHGRPGVATSAYTAPSLSSVTARLSGPAGADWDLALVDRDSGRVLGGSAGWGAGEVVQAYARPGQGLAVQAGRISGSAPRGAGAARRLGPAAAR